MTEMYADLGTSLKSRSGSPRSIRGAVAGEKLREVMADGLE